MLDEVPEEDEAFALGCAFLAMVRGEESATPDGWMDDAEEMFLLDVSKPLLSLRLNIPQINTFQYNHGVTMTEARLNKVCRQRMSSAFTPLPPPRTCTNPSPCTSGGSTASTPAFGTISHRGLYAP